MYQALYRKWRPRVFEDVAGQEHITETLRRQIETGRLSHAYLFTGTRGTGKTTCAKLLARAVNCEHPVNGSPCNRCPSCVGIESGSILDVLELDAASNNRVDDVRAILDEAAYTPAAVKKRVYIVDEVHMLSAQAFNALLQILEEPPGHLMFILATTEIHKVPATIKSRCQQFSFKRLPADVIAARLRHVAGQEGLPLTDGGAALIARLADGGMRDALSLLDQCRGDGRPVGEEEILASLGLAGNTEVVQLMSEVAAGDAERALTRLDRLYRGGREMASLLGELASLARDLLVRRAAPTAGAALMTGGFDGTALKELSAALTTPRLTHMLAILQKAGADMAHSVNRRIDAELCIITLCHPETDGSEAALAARLDMLERRLEQDAALVPQAAQAAPRPRTAPPPPAEPAPSADDPPPWLQEEAPPPPPKPPRAAPPPKPVAPKVSKPATPPSGGNTGGSWETLRARLKETLSVADFSFVGDPGMVTGSVGADTVTLWAVSEPVKGFIDTPEILAAVAKTAETLYGRPFRAAVKVGPAPTNAAQPPSPPTAEEPDALDAFLAEAQGLGNITVSD